MRVTASHVVNPETDGQFPDKVPAILSDRRGSLWLTVFLVVLIGAVSGFTTAYLAVERGPGLPGETEAGNAKRQERTDAVLDELMESEASDAGEEPRATSALPEVDESVDSGFIDDLLGDSDDGRKE